MMTHFRGVILDVDGTLVDSNDAHAQAWAETLQAHGYDVSFEDVRPLIGMGSDKLLPEVSGIELESEEGKRISKERGDHFKKNYLPKLQPFAQVKPLLDRLRDEGLKLAVASSAATEDLKELLKVAHAEDLLDEATSGEEVEESKPDPDVIHAALQELGLPAEQVVMIGDTPYDVEAASRASVATIAVRCGGWDDKGLKGAIAIYDDPADLLAHYDSSPLKSGRS
jgi:HAD superfamily hydrolase (TIGR01509 family)